jgi:membrane protease YdiL (CAAX protease family)
LIAVTGSVFLARWLIDRRSIPSLGLKLNLRALTDLGLGIIITFLMMGLVYALQWTAGWLTFEGFAWQFDPFPKMIGSIVLGLLAYILVGWNEELLSRGYHLQNLIDGTNIIWGLVISSIIFGLAHLGNPNATWFGAVGVALAGLFLAYGYLRTRGLWLPIGLHIGWNFFEGVVFGFPVSGMESYHLARITVTGSEPWTGGSFGPEAGLVVLPALILGAVLIYLTTRGRLRDEDNAQEGTDIP